MGVVGVRRTGLLSQYIVFIIGTVTDLEDVWCFFKLGKGMVVGC